MRKFSTTEGDLFMGKGRYEEEVSSMREFLYKHQSIDELIKDGIPRIIRKFVEHDELKKTYLELYQQLTGLSRYGILEAHGEDNPWLVEDGKRLLKVQNWINRHDGEYLALLISCCNPQAAEVRSKKSLLFVPNQTYSEVYSETLIFGQN